MMKDDGKEERRNKGKIISLDFFLCPGGDQLKEQQLWNVKTGESIKEQSFYPLQVTISYIGKKETYLIMRIGPWSCIVI